MGQFNRSLGAGTGTAAGFAWPLFGLISGSLGLAVTGLAALILGLISIVLFVFVFIPITFFNYKKYLNEKKALQQKLKYQQNRLIENCYDYLLVLREKCTYGKTHIESDKLVVDIKNEISKNIADIKAEISKNIAFIIEISKTIENITTEISKNIKQKNPGLITQIKVLEFQMQLLQEQVKVSQDQIKTLEILENNNNIIKKFVNETNKPDETKKNGQIDVKKLNYAAHSTLINGKKITIVKDRDAKQEIKKSFKENDTFVPRPLSTFEIIANLVTDFTGGFGSIAGCGAGAISVLCGIGFISGLSAVPFVGWMVLGAALIFGTAMAVIAVQKAKQSHKYNEWIDHYFDVSESIGQLNKSANMNYINHIKHEKSLAPKATVTPKLTPQPQLTQGPNQEKVKLSKEKVKRNISRSLSGPISLPEKYLLWSEKRDNVTHQINEIPVTKDALKMKTPGIC